MSISIGRRRLLPPPPASPKTCEFGSLKTCELLSECPEGRPVLETGEFDTANLACGAAAAGAAAGLQSRSKVCPGVPAEFRKFAPSFSGRARHTLGVRRVPVLYRLVPVDGL